ncbi:MAG: hypothetical protein IPH95_00115 [Candidatus Promineofilum sp.]|nr:hypothetical protein [Promineifilum sp.]
MVPQVQRQRQPAAQRAQGVTAGAHEVGQHRLGQKAALGLLLLEDDLGQHDGRQVFVGGVVSNDDLIAGANQRGDPFRVM